MTIIRLCETADAPEIFEIINDSAQAYKGVIPEDAWHEPYMSMAELESEIGKGVRFYGCEMAGRLVGVMGIQDVRDVTLIRHESHRHATHTYWRMEGCDMGDSVLSEERLCARR